MKFALFFLFAFVAGTFAAIVSPPAPSAPCPNNAGYTVDSLNAPSAEDFLLNTFHYNKLDLQNGSPKGPYFAIDSSKTSSFFPNGSFDASLLLYADQAHTQQIGTATLHSDLLSSTGDANQFLGGDMLVSTHFTTLLFPASDATHANFRDQTTTVHFQEQNVHSSPSNAAVSIANRLQLIGGKLYMTLWGSSGWNSTLGQFQQSGQGLGMDLRFGLSCPSSPPPPPIIEGCPCDSNLQTETYGSYQEGTLITKTGSPCVSLAWA